MVTIASAAAAMVVVMVAAAIEMTAAIAAAAKMVAAAAMVAAAMEWWWLQWRMGIVGGRRRSTISGRGDGGSMCEAKAARRQAAVGWVERDASCAS